MQTTKTDDVTVEASIDNCRFFMSVKSMNDSKISLNVSFSLLRELFGMAALDVLGQNVRVTSTWINNSYLFERKNFKKKSVSDAAAKSCALIDFLYKEAEILPLSSIFEMVLVAASELGAVLWDNGKLVI